MSILRIFETFSITD